MKLKDLINEKVLDDLRKNDKSQYKDIQSKYNKYQSILKDVRKIQGHLSNVAKAMSNLDHALAKMKLDLGI